jgi:hypothetical protein
MSAIRQAEPEGALPPVREMDATDDAAWFADRPRRLFRTRLGDGGSWIIRRRRQGADPDVFLRTFSSAPVRADSEGEIARLWFATAYPDWPPDRVFAAVRKLIKRRRR